MHDHPSRRNSFNTDYDDLTTTVAASETTDTKEVGQLTSPLFSQERKIVDSAFLETNRQLESQRLELYQANQWVDQGAKRKDQFVWRIRYEKQKSSKKMKQKIAKNRNYEEPVVKKLKQPDS